MVKAKGRPVSFNTMVKYFIRNYDIPTKKDLNRIERKVDRLEKLIKQQAAQYRRSALKNGMDKENPATPHYAKDQVLELIKNNPGGIGIAKIAEHTGFGEKKLRNIIYRLHKFGRIRRIRRGLYEIVE